MTAKLEALLLEISKELNEVGFQQEPKSLYQPAEYLLSLGGKRLRPLLVLLGCGAFSDPKKAMSQALAVEVFHNFSLMHDDIMDEAPLRRGHKTVHEKWGLNTAILSGDAMLVKSYQLLSQADNTVLPELLSLFNTTAMQVCEGQQYDMDFEKRESVTEQEYIQMIQLKTSVLLGCALQMGAIVGGASKADAEHLYQFGLLLGTSFQIKDDWLDCFGAPEKVGKQVGGDILANKKTLLLIHALQVAKGQEKDQLLKWLSETDFTPEHKIVEVKNLYKTLKVDDYANVQMNAFYTEAISHVDQLSISDSAKQEFLNFAKWILGRES